MLASTWMDMVVGVDIHFEMVPTPAGPIPTPFPNPFIGMVIDPAGLAVGLALGAALALATGGTPTGPVLINCMPATNVGTEAKGMGHILIPPGASWMPMPKFPKPTFRGPPELPGLPVKPEDDAISIMGSTTVTIMGSSGVRMGEMWMSCGEPLRLPSSVVIAIPKGPLVLVGGPPGVNLLDALLAMIRTKWVAGYLHSLVSRVKNDRLRNILSKGVCFLTGHPVDVATGRVLTDHVDFELPGPLPLRFERNYASSWAHRDGPLGPGWSHSLDEAVWFERGKIVYLAEDGREIEFDVFDFAEHSLRPGQEVYEPINQLMLRFRRADLIEIVTPAGVFHEFSPLANQRSDSRGERWRLIRRRARDGRAIALGYDARGNLSSVRDSAGRVIGFEHDAWNRLIAVRLPHPSGEGFSECARYAYDAAGDLVQVTDARGASWTFAYKHHLLVRETNRNGLSFYFAYDGWSSDAYCVRTWGDGGIYDHVLDYAKGVSTIVTNGLGHASAYKLNAIGQVLEVTDASGATTKYEYDPRSLKVTKETAPDGGETCTEYDERGNPVRITRADGSSVALEYDEHNRLVRGEDALGGEWRWVYDGAGRLISRSNPLGETSRFTWGEHGLVAFTDAAGQLTEFIHDASGELSWLRAPDGSTASWSYDRLGRIIAYGDVNGNVRRREYDALGRMIRAHEPDGNVVEVDYDAEGNYRRGRDRLYDVEFEYTALNRLAARSQAGTRIEFEYDREGQLTVIRNEHGSIYEFVLDPAGHVLEEHGFDGLRRQYVRDAAGRAKQVRRPSGRSTRYEYDSRGRVVRVMHGDGSSEAYAYRPDGALIRAENQHSTVEIERDAVGRITREVVGEDWVASTFDVLGRRRLVRSSRGLVQKIRHGVMGDVLGIEAELPSAREVALEPASMVPDAQSFTVTFERDRFGLELERRLPGGVRARWQRDALGRPIRQEIWREDRFQVAKQHYWGVGDRLLRVIDSLTGPVDYQHDVMGNLAAAARVDAKLELRLPDAVGNLYRSGDRGDREYGRAGELKSSRDALGRVTVYAYDEEGNLVRKTEPDGQTWTYAWSDAGTLSRVTRPDGEQVEFTYDAFARRTSKTFRGRTTRWVWDGDVPLHEWVEASAAQPPAAVESRLRDHQDGLRTASARAREALLVARGATAPPVEARSESGPASLADGNVAAAAVVTWLFEPGTYAPLAKLSPYERLGIVTDHLGTPKAMYDESGHEVWNLDLDVYGDPCRARGDRSACPFRFPGQYEDAETGLYYNRYRYYDPVAGQYTSQDPLRYASSLSLYGYVDDPTVQIDPQGLHIASALFTDSSGATHELGKFDSSGGSHSEPKILDAVRGKGGANGGKLEITSLGPKGDGSTSFFRSKSGKAYPAGPLPPCGKRSANCDDLLHRFASENNLEITYRWGDNVRVYHPDGRITHNGQDVPHGCS